MSRPEQHGAYSLIIYYVIFMIWKKTFILPPLHTFLIILFGIFPDFDTLYWIIKTHKSKNSGTEYQHHFHYWTHWPLSYTPLVIALGFSIIINFYIEYFLIPVIGIYIGHFIFDSISSGDGIMWGKIPWKKERFAPYINFYRRFSDGYHGRYWDVRYRKTLICKIGYVAVIIAIVLICLFQIYTINVDGWYLFSIIFLFVMLLLGLKRSPKLYLEEPPQGRYADYRISIKYINGLSEKNRNKHITRYLDLLKSKGILVKLNKN
ncbi:MAG: hypothetical protein ACFFDX_08170 [Candidatus Odinarchaeota archaeon]